MGKLKTAAIAATVATMIGCAGSNNNRPIHAHEDEVLSKAVKQAQKEICYDAKIRFANDPTVTVDCSEYEKN